jgi:glycosyltransferase involved in cell wall biosynthesis
MRIGISAVYYASGGSLTNLVQLLREWGRAGALQNHHIIVFASPSASQALKAQLPADVLAQLEWVRVGNEGRGLLARLWAEQVVLPRLLRRHHVDVVFCPANVIPYATSVPTVVTFQNAAPFCPSITFRSLRHIGWWVRFRLLGVMIGVSTKRATRMVFLSSWFQDLMNRRFRIARERGVVIPRARITRPDASNAPANPPYLLYVSHLNPYKNVLEVIDAFAACEAPEWRLVLAGRTNFPWYCEAILERIRDHRLEERVVLTGEIDSNRVKELLAGAGAFVFASTCENCPTALIEAMSYGLPIACSNAGVMPEVGGDAVDYFDPHDVESIRTSLSRLLRDESYRASLASRSRERGGEFPNEAEVAARTLAVLEEAARSAR